MKIEAEKNKYGDVAWESDPQLFAQVVVTWQQWIGHSGEHLHAAQILWSHIEQRDLEIKRLMESGQRVSVRMAPSLTGVYFLHCAFSIENAFKGVIVGALAEETRREISQTQRIPRVLRSHDLFQLAQKAGFQTGVDEEYSLSFLTRYGTWAGRYPLPVRNADNAVTGKLSDGNHYMMGGYRPEHVPGFVVFAGTVYSWARQTLDERCTHSPEP